MGKKAFIPAFLKFRLPWVCNFNGHWSRVLCTEGGVCLQENFKRSFKQWPISLSVYELKITQVWHCKTKSKHQEEQWGDPKHHFSILNCRRRNETQQKNWWKSKKSTKKPQTKTNQQIIRVPKAKKERHSGSTGDKKGYLDCLALTETPVFRQNFSSQHNMPILTLESLHDLMEQSCSSPGLCANLTQSFSH